MAATAITAAVSCIVTTFIGIAVGALRERLKHATTEENALKAGMRYLLKDRITQMCEHALRTGTISTRQLKVLLEMQGAYENLGGNDFVHELIEKVKASVKVVP